MTFPFLGLILLHLQACPSFGVHYIPTTLVGLVDAAIGIKNGINFGSKKNMLGNFYPAIGSVNDVRFLSTLPKSELACGIAEIVKVGIIRDSRIFELIEAYGEQLVDSHFQQPVSVVREVLLRSELVMLNELSKNLYESKHQRLLDFGHTFSPTVEALSDYKIPHGEAVAIDMLLSTVLAMRRGLCNVQVVDRLAQVLHSVRLPLRQQTASVTQLFAALDTVRAHRGGELHLVVPTCIGEAEFLQEVNHLELQEATNYIETMERRLNASNCV